MNKCIEYLLITAIVVYIVDLSGFTQSWKQAISAKFGGKCRIGKPFDCSLCMTVIYGRYYRPIPQHHQRISQDGPAPPV